MYYASPYFIQLFSEMEYYSFNIGPMHFVQHIRTRTLAKLYRQ